MELASNLGRFIFFGPLWNLVKKIEVETQWSIKATTS